MQYLCLLAVGMCFKSKELHELFEIVEYFLFAVLVALYEEPEKPNSALEYPFSLLWSAAGDLPRSVSAVSHLQMKWRDLLGDLNSECAFSR